MVPVSGRHKRTRWFAPAVLLVLLAFVARPIGAEPYVAYGHGLLWEITRPGVAPNYLFGTMHVTDPRVVNLPAPVRAAFGRAKRLVLEVVFTERTYAEVSEEAYLPEGHLLSKIVDRHLFDAAVVALGRYGFSREKIDRMTPWGVYIVLSMPFSEISRHLLGELFLDRRLQQDAERVGKPALALETAAEQLAIFSSVAEADQIVLMRGAVAASPQIEADFDKMVVLYAARDLASLYTQTVSAYSEDPSHSEEFRRVFVDRILYQRNRNMVDRMEEHLRRGGTFVAVGAAHLPGDEGLLRLLDRRGYSIRRIY